MDAVVGIRSFRISEETEPDIEVELPSVNVPEEELREMVGASLVPATEAVKEARVLVAGEELESVTPRSKTRFPDVEGLSEVFLYSRALRRASACASVRVPPPSLAKVRVLSPPVTEAVTEWDPSESRRWSRHLS